MNFKTFLFLLSTGLLLWLLIDSAYQLDLAATKNNAFTSIQKHEVEQMQSIDSVKVFAKAKLDVIRQNTRTDSSLAVKRIWMILAVMMLQFFLWMKRSSK